MDYDFDEATVRVVNQLFKHMLAMSPAFKQAWPTESEFSETKREWMIAFKEANINSIERLQRGLKHFRMSPSPFIPSPGQFVEMCKLTHEDVGAPDVHQAFTEVMAYDQKLRFSEEIPKLSHPCVKYAYELAGGFFLRTNTRLKAFSEFQRCYDEAISAYADGKILNQIENQKTEAVYQEYVGRMKSDIRLRLLPSDTRILSFDEWCK